MQDARQPRYNKFTKVGEAQMNSPFNLTLHSLLIYFNDDKFTATHFCSIPGIPFVFEDQLINRELSSAVFYPGINLILKINL